MQKTEDQLFEGVSQNYCLVPNKNVEKYDNVYVVKGLKDKKLYFLKKHAEIREEERKFILQRIKTQSLLKMHELWIGLHESRTFIEYCDGGDIGKILKERQLSKLELKKIILDVGEQIEAIHFLQYVHSDIKPINIVKKNIQEANKIVSSYKLCDFGSVIRINTKTYCSKWATSEYCSPEVVENKDKFDTSIDIWSFAVTIVEMMKGVKLFKDQQSEYLTKKNIKTYLSNQQEIHQKIDKLFEEEGINKQIKQMLHPDPSKRPSISGVCQFFESYFSQVNEEDEQLNDKAQLQSQISELEIKINSLKQLYNQQCQGQFEQTQDQKVQTFGVLESTQTFGAQDNKISCSICSIYKNIFHSTQNRINELYQLDSYTEEQNKELKQKSDYLVDIQTAYSSLKNLLSKPPK